VTGEKNNARKKKCAQQIKVEKPKKLIFKENQNQCKGRGLLSLEFN
jgi:hypothetical protein